MSSSSQFTPIILELKLDLHCAFVDNILIRGKARMLTWGGGLTSEYGNI